METIKDNVYWTGVRDPGLVSFDIVMETRYGTTYNSYLINAGKKVIIDTVKESFRADFTDRIREVIDPAAIDYIICNHTEPDHSGSLRHLLSLAPNATVVGSGQALSYLHEMYSPGFRSMKVKDGDVLDLGDKTLELIGAPNLHWPDSIYTYLREDRLLFTCDSFGAHYCSRAGIFDDEAGEYLNMINGDDKYILITYVSAYGYTREMANSIAKGIRLAGLRNIDVMDIEFAQPAELEEKIARASGLLVGSPTINH